MKTIASLFATALAVTLLAQAEPLLNLTNDVPITDDGMRLIITDQSGLNEETIRQPRELKAGDGVCYVLHNTSTNKYGTLWLGKTNSFAVELMTTNGLPIAKTERAKAMGAGPKSPSNPYSSHAIVVGPPPGGFSIMDFPKLTELFQFPSNGVYVLEVRYWGWWHSKHRFVLSPPVRVRVVNAPH